MNYQQTVTGRSRCTIIIGTAKGDASFPGIDYSNGSRPIVVVAKTEDLVIVKVPGGKHFSGIGMQSNHPTVYIVFAILEVQLETAARQELWVTELVEFPVRKLVP